VRQAEGGKQAEVEPVDLDYFVDPGKQVAEFLMDPGFVASLEGSWPTVIHGLSQGSTNKKAKINDMLTDRHAVAALVQLQLHPPKTTAPASWRLTLPWVSPGADWWVTGATGRDNCAR
jgi:hypothetical protein